MDRKPRHFGTDHVGKSLPIKKSIFRLPGFFFGLMAGVVLAGSAGFYYAKTQPSPAPGRPHLEQLLALSPEELEKVDIGLMNLLCAQGLKGAENLDIDKCLATLDEWAEKVRRDTQARLPAFHANPGKYENSEAKFRAITLVLTLQEEYRVHYDPASIGNWDFSDSSAIFIHGLLGDKRTGTCTSMPVLCTAIGRRLGYPMKIVLAKAHSFCRWDDGGEKFNIETCCAAGVDIRDDAYYMKWPQEVSQADLIDGYLLKSLSAAETLGSFMNNRVGCLADTKRFSEAQIAGAWANHLMPGRTVGTMVLLSLADHEMNELAARDLKVAGNVPGYAIPIDYDGRQTNFVWRLPAKPVIEPQMSYRPKRDPMDPTPRIEPFN